MSSDPRDGQYEEIKISIWPVDTTEQMKSAIGRIEHLARQYYGLPKEYKLRLTYRNGAEDTLSRVECLFSKLVDDEECS